MKFVVNKKKRIMKKIVLLAMGLVMSMTVMAQDEFDNENKV